MSENPLTEVDALLERASACTKCLEAARNAYVLCVDAAGDDEAKKSKCLETLNTALLDCKANHGCP